MHKKGHFLKIPCSNQLKDTATVSGNAEKVLIRTRTCFCHKPTKSISVPDCSTTQCEKNLGCVYLSKIPRTCNRNRQKLSTFWSKLPEWIRILLAIRAHLVHGILSANNAKHGWVGNFCSSCWQLWIISVRSLTWTHFGYIVHRYVLLEFFLLSKTLFLKMM